MAAKTFNVSFPRELVDLIDEQAARDFTSRSEYIRRAVVAQLRAEREVSSVFDRANSRGRALGYTSEQDVYNAIDA